VFGKTVDFRTEGAEYPYMTQAARIIDKLGGTRRAAAILASPPSTIQSWKDAGFIPARRQEEVIRKAKEAGIEIEPAEFFAASVLA
jgi:hypothetical protein